MAELIIKSKDQELQRVDLEQGDITLGRHPSNQIHLDSAAISDRHARFFTVGEVTMVQDLNSTNGTFINEEPITRKALKDGDEIQIGNITIKYNNEQARAKQELREEDLSVPPLVALEAIRPARKSRPEIPISQMPAGIEILSGPNQGKRVLFRARHSELGHYDQHGVCIKRDEDGFELESLDPDGKISINDVPLDSDNARIHDGDFLQIGETRLQFFLGDEVDDDSPVAESGSLEQSDLATEDS